MDITTQSMQTIKATLAALPQYEPESTMYFHGGMLMREVWRPAGVMVVGRRHKKEHLYIILEGRVAITDGNGAKAVEAGPGTVIKSMPGTERAVYALTDARCLTVQRCDATTMEGAERELMEDDPDVLYTIDNKVRPGVLRHEATEVLT
jgi:hypothetical protein